MTAKDLLNEQGGELSPLSVRIAPELKAKMASLRKETGKRPSEIVSLALGEFFKGYTVVEETELDA